MPATSFKKFPDDSITLQPSERHPSAILTRWLLVEAIPLHLPTAHVTADEILSIAKEDAVCNRVDIWRGEVRNAGVAGVPTETRLCGTDELSPDLQPGKPEVKILAFTISGATSSNLLDLPIFIIQ